MFFLLLVCFFHANGAVKQIVIWKKLNFNRNSHLNFSKHEIVPDAVISYNVPGNRIVQNIKKSFVIYTFLDYSLEDLGEEHLRHKLSVSNNWEDSCNKIVIKWFDSQFKASWTDQSQRTYHVRDE